MVGNTRTLVALLLLMMVSVLDYRTHHWAITSLGWNEVEVALRCQTLDDLRESFGQYGEDGSKIRRYALKEAKGLSFVPRILSLSALIELRDL